MVKISSSTSANLSSEEVAPRRGRPRDPSVDGRILRTTVEVLGANGYSNASMDAIAAKAGVSKPTIYRRWSTKIELVTNAITIMVTDDPPTTTSDVWEALHTELVLFESALNRGRGLAIIGTLLAHEELRPELIAQFRDHVARDRRDRVRKVIRHGIASGQLPPSTDENLILNLLFGYYYSTHIGGQKRPHDWQSVCLALVKRSLNPPANGE